MQNEAQHFLVFGATGAIGGAIAQAAQARGAHVTGVARTIAPGWLPGAAAIPLVPGHSGFTRGSLRTETPYTAVVWAQGANCNDSVYDLDLPRHRELYAANVEYILITLKALLDECLLAPRSRLCIISSIWQNLARQNKLSYCVTKSALQGLVLSASADLARDGHLINAVLPGAIETPMTRRNLAPEQIDRIASATGFNRLTSLEDVASAVLSLCSPENTGLTGQFLTADLGFSHVRIV